MRKYPDNYFLYDPYGGDFPIEQFFVHNFDCMPSKYVQDTFYDKTIEDYFLSNGFVKESICVSTHKDFGLYVRYFLINEDKKIAIKLYNEKDLKYNYFQFEIFYDFSVNGDVKNTLEWEVIETYQRKKPKASISLVSQGQNGLSTEDFELHSGDMDLGLNYGESFLKIHDVIIERLNNDNDKGIILLHGDPGTGKCVIGKTKIILRNKKTGEIFEKNIEDLM